MCIQKSVNYWVMSIGGGFMNKSESKYYNTACLMDQALLLLLDKKEFDYITVKEICEKAGVNRSTFYLHYEKMTDLLVESIAYLKKQLIEKFNQTNQLDISSDNLNDFLLYTPKYTLPYLEFIKENRKVFMAAISQPIVFEVDNTFNNMYFKLFEPILEKFSVPSNEKKYMIKFYINGIHAIIIEWIKNNCLEDLDFISNLIIKCINNK